MNKNIIMIALAVGLFGCQTTTPEPPKGMTKVEGNIQSVNYKGQLDGIEYNFPQKVALVDAVYCTDSPSLLEKLKGGYAERVKGMEGTLVFTSVKNSYAIGYVESDQYDVSSCKVRVIGEKERKEIKLFLDEKLAAIKKIESDKEAKANALRLKEEEKIKKEQAKAYAIEQKKDAMHTSAMMGSLLNLCINRKVLSSKYKKVIKDLKTLGKQKSGKYWNNKQYNKTFKESSTIFSAMNYSTLKSECNKLR